MISFKTLKKTKRNNIIIEFPGGSIPLYQGMYGTQTARSLPGHYWLNSVETYGNDVYIAKLFNSNLKPLYLTVYEGTKVSVIREGMKEWRDKLDIYHKANLIELLGHSFQVGSDPEVFVVDKNDTVFPAFKFLGSKSNKHSLTTEKCAAYWDGFQAEFETLPNNCLAYHVDSIHRGLDLVLREARKVDPEAKFSIRTTLPIDHDVLMAAAPEHVEFGCMPSFNIYGHAGLQASGRDVPYRSAGGHIHFGMGKFNPEDKKDARRIENIVKALDAILGVACVSLFAKYDNPTRRKMYGLAGEYRLPPHGLEYRTLSNAWMVHPMITHLVFDVARKVVVMGEKGFLKFWEGNEKETVEIINTCNAEQARVVLKRNEDVFKKILKAAYINLTSPEIKKLYDVFLEGMESAVCPEDMEKNWKLGGVAKHGWTTHSDGDKQCVRMTIKSLMTKAKEKKEEAA